VPQLTAPRYKQRRLQREREAFRATAEYAALRVRFAETLVRAMPSSIAAAWPDSYPQGGECAPHESQGVAA
jgi:hypothetical protein